MAIIVAVASRCFVHVRLYAVQVINTQSMIYKISNRPNAKTGSIKLTNDAVRHLIGSSVGYVGGV